MAGAVRHTSAVIRRHTLVAASKALSPIRWGEPHLNEPGAAEFPEELFVRDQTARVRSVEV